MTAVVTAAEAALLRLARVSVGAEPAVAALRLFAAKVDPPAKLGPTAAGLLSETLAKGLVSALAKGGGWRQLGKRRLWERTGPPPLHFTANVVVLLRWLLGSPLLERDPAPVTLPGPWTPAEDAWLALFIARLQGTAVEPVLLRQPAVRAAPLVALMHASALGFTAAEQVPALDVAQSATFVDGLSGELARVWADAERAKAGLERPQAVSAMGVSQALVLEAFLRVVEAAGRRDLATFLVEAAQARPPLVLRQFAASWSLRERAQAQRDAGSLLKALGTLRRWHDEHRVVRFIDEGYEHAQALVQAWGTFGEAGFRAAEVQLARLEALPDS